MIKEMNRNENEVRSIKEWQKICHDNAVKHGFWEGELNNNIYVKIALFHSEISEFMEDVRHGLSPNEVLWHDPEDGLDKTSQNLLGIDKAFFKPIGPAIELADLVIRIFDSCEAWGIDLEKVIEIKHKYNETRPYMHGGKQA